eukprot:5077124-Prymnesium_polylepis.1
MTPRPLRGPRVNFSVKARIKAAEPNLPTGIQYKTFVDVIMGSVTGMVEAMLLSVANQRK